MAHKFNDQIDIDKTKLPQVKNIIDQTKLDIKEIKKITDEKEMEDIKSDCEILKNAFYELINVNLPNNIKNNFKVNNYFITSSDFNLKSINNLKKFEKYCGYDISAIEKDLSKEFGTETNFYLSTGMNKPYLAVNFPSLYLNSVQK